MDFTKYRQHPRFGVVIIQMRGLQNNEVSVLKLNGESLRAKEEDLTDVSTRFKRLHYITRGFGVYVPNTVDDESLKSIVLTFMKLEIVKGDNHVVDEVLKVASQMELRTELDAFIRDF